MASMYWQFCPLSFPYHYTGSSQLFRVMEWRKVMDNPRPRLKQKQSKRGAKWI
jgi:hypothetical protein